MSCVCKSASISSVRARKMHTTEIASPQLVVSSVNCFTLRAAKKNLLFVLSPLFFIAGMGKRQLGSLERVSFSSIPSSAPTCTTLVRAASRDRNRCFSLPNCQCVLANYLNRTLWKTEGEKRKPSCSNNWQVLG